MRVAVRVGRRGRLLGVSRVASSGRRSCGSGWLSVAVTWVLRVSRYAACRRGRLGEAGVAIAVGGPDWRRRRGRAGREGRGGLSWLLVVVGRAVLGCWGVWSVAWVGSFHLVRPEV